MKTKTKKLYKWVGYRKTSKQGWVSMGWRLRELTKAEYKRITLPKSKRGKNL